MLWGVLGSPRLQIGDGLGLDSSTTTAILKRLEAAGFVRRQRDTKDEHQFRVTLTDKGSAVRAEAETARDSVVSALGGSEEQIQQLKLAIDEVHRTLRPRAA